MSLKPEAPVYLARASYRQRRLRDLSRALPLFGIVLWSIPLMWPRGLPDGARSASVMLFLFGVWLLLIALSAFLSRRLLIDELASPTVTTGAEEPR